MKKTIHILLLFLVSVTSGLSQQHPVQVNVTLQPPYSLSLADYVAPGTDRVNLTLLLNDLNRPTYQARLRLTIEGLGITLRTRETFISQPIMLQGGIPTFVGATELAPYFNPQNIDFAGFTRQQYQSAGRLPEGLYRVCIEVLDYNRGNVVSNQGCAMAWMMLNDPPLLNQPQNNTKVIATEPQNVMFNWTPRHTASPNASHSVEYLFRLVEVYPEGRNPMEAMRVSRPIYETYTTTTSLYYGVAEPNLIPGRTYAWQLQARDTEGRDLFKNQGYSEIFSFQFGDPCDVPASLEANVLSDKAIRLGWQPGFNHTAFRAEYRPVGGEGHWYSSESYLDYLNVDGLRPDTEYEVRLRGHCGTLQGAFTPTRRVRTAQASEQEFACGAGSVIPINNTLPQMQLFEGQTIDAQGFRVRLTEVTGSNGRFSGAGYATVPFLANAKVRVTFDDIFVNEDLQMVRGTIRTVYNPDSPFMVDGDKVQEKIEEKLAPKPKTWGDDFNGDTIRIMEPVAKVDLSADGSTILIITESGVTIEKPVGDEILIVDSEGNETIVREDGTIEKPGGLITRPGGGSAGDPPSADNPKLKDLELPLVEFAPVQDQKYGFDRLEQQALAGKYETTEIRGSPYSVPWKSVEVGRTDDLVAEHARINNKQATGAVKFKTLAANLPGMKTGEGEYRLSVTGSFHGNEEELFAVYVQKDTVNDTEDETQLGKLKVVSYEKTKKSLVIVPVNDAGAKYNLNTLAAQINGIYRQAVAEFDVTVKNPVRIDTTEWDRNGDGAIADDKGMLANYTKEMNALVKAYERQGTLDKEAYYIFLAHKSEKGRAGYMPYKQQVGFIFTESISSAEDLAVTIAHELGHGAFHLKHIFEEYVLGQSTTDNLMDYRRGTRLHKYQWDEVHDPQARMNWFKGDEEMAYSDKEYINKVFQQIRCAFLNGQHQFNDFQKTGSFSSKTDEYGDITLIVTKQPAIIGKVAHRTEEKTSGAGNRTTHYTLYTLDFGGVKVEAKKYNYLNDVEGNFDKLQNYLFPQNSDAAFKDYNEVLEGLLDKTTFASEDIESIRSIANCGAQYFSTRNKFLTIRIIATQNSLKESYEDLVLDLIENYNGDYVEYANEFLGYLHDDPVLLRRLFYGLDNVEFYWGKEENFDRFMQVIFALWVASDFSKRERYEYKPYVFSGPATPYTLVYDGSFLFPKIEYKIRQIGNKIDLGTKVYTPEGYKYGQIIYDVFQPVYLLSEKDKKAWSPSSDIPAIVLAGIIKTDQYENTIKSLTLTLDVVLTFTAVGNLSKLRHLNNLQKGVRLVVAGLEVGSGALDIFLNYTDICVDEEFCTTLREYNFYLQLGLMGGEALSALYKARIKAIQTNTKEQYLKNRDKLIAKYGEESDYIKALDEHFGDLRNVFYRGKFSSKEIDEYVVLATKQNDKTKVMLGEFIEGSSNSYERRARSEGYTFFSLEDKWDEAKKIVDNGIDELWKEEMWKINKGFIDKQKSLGKEFYFSQEPWDFPTKTFRSREAEYLVDLGAKDFQKINENTWKVIW